MGEVQTDWLKIFEDRKARKSPSPLDIIQAAVSGKFPLLTEKPISTKHEARPPFRRVDFNRKPEKGTPTKQILYDAELFKELDQKELADFLQLLGEQYNAIAAILGLPLGENDRYILRIVNSSFIDPIAEHLPPMFGKKGEISLNSLEVLSLLHKRTTHENFLHDELYIRVISSLAHELYHARQEKFFSKWIRARRYISAKEDYKAYYKQRRESSARLFQSKYVEHLATEKGSGNSIIRATAEKYQQTISDPDKLKEFETKIVLRKFNHFFTNLLTNSTKK